MNAVTVIGVAALAIVSITSHEAAHGFVADRLGDPTARERGRLTLNPIPHIDLFFTILLPLFLILSGSGFIFGGAKPVPVDVSRLRNPRRDWALVGAAGPAMNVLMAATLTAVLSVAVLVGLADSSSSLTEILAVGIFLNALLAVFNLIPIPPLDGSRVVQYFLSGETLALYRRLERFGLLIIMAAVYFVPQLQVPLSEAIFGLIALVTTPFGVAAIVESVLRNVLFG
ncbi:MAG: site-2 protease family protein [Acidobacteria bacterium]|nr:site-2 protease family protein [Acidobacteriota bacterium]